MQYDKIARSYKAQSVQTASPGKLVLMLFDGYLRFTTSAKRSFELEDLTKRNEGINNNLIKAQNIDEALEIADRIIIMSEASVVGEHINHEVDFPALLAEFSGKKINHNQRYL